MGPASVAEGSTSRGGRPAQPWRRWEGRQWCLEGAEAAWVAGRHLEGRRPLGRQAQSAGWCVEGLRWLGDGSGEVRSGNGGDEQVSDGGGSV
jgi:hypothetical protein